MTDKNATNLPDANDLPETLTIRFSQPLTSLSGKESWEEIQLREPLFHEVSGFYKESEKSNPHDAMAWLMAKISEANQVALSKMPIRKFREGQAYLLAFLNWFPASEFGKTK